MNEYTLSDLSVGMKEEFSALITEEMMLKFREISGDKNPLHSEPIFAQKMGFPNTVVFGMLTASLLSTLGGCYLPGKYCLIQGVEIKFIKPVMVGDTLTVTGEVAVVERELNHVVINVVMRKKSGEKVLRGKLKVGVLNE